MNTLTVGSRAAYAFGPFTLAADGTLLVRDGVPLALPPKVLKTLLVLVERAGHVVTKAALIDAVWPDCVVEEGGLARNISVLRQALGAEGRAYVVTASRVGYRFAAPVRRGILAAVGQPWPMAATADGAGRAKPPDQPGHLAVTRLLILPFRLLREDPDIAFLAFSLPDAIVGSLSGSTSLVVRSSAVAARFAGDAFDPRRLANEAEVDAVVTGTLLRSGDTIRMNAQLVSVPEGAVLWSETSQVSARGVFELQDNLVDRIVRSLAPSLTAVDRARLRADVPANAMAYECFLRANEVVGPQGVANAPNLRIARELYRQAVEEDPRFAPAWARLGRCHYLIGKSEAEHREHVPQAEACFTRALELSPDLPLAHNLYALFEIDQGRAPAAMVRLIARARGGSAQPELYAALVQACRFCGLLEPAIVAHERARALASSIGTGGYLAYFHLGDEASALRESVNLCWLVEAIAVGPRDPERALAILAEDRGLTGFARTMVAALRATLEGRPELAREQAQRIFDTFPDPEAVYFAARTVARFGAPQVLDVLDKVLDRGFVLYRVLLRPDPWLDPIRTIPGYGSLFARSREAYSRCLAAYIDAGGEVLLGPAPPPERLEAMAAPTDAAEARP